MSDAARSALFYGVQLPIDRDGQRMLGVARQLMQQNRLSDALTLLDRLLAQPEDSMGPDGSSVKRSAMRLMREGLRNADPSNRSLFAAQAERLLGGADGLEQLRQLATRYPPGGGGDSIWRELARRESEAGRYAAAAEIGRELLRWRDDPSGGDNTLSLRIAADLLRSGDAPGAEALVSGRRAPGDIEPLVRSASRGLREWRRDQAPEVWRGPGGAAARDTRVEASAPGPWRVWRAELSGSASDSRRLDALRSRLPRAAAPFTAGGVVAVGGVLVVTGERGLIAIDAATGKRLWVTEQTAAAGDSGRMSLERLDAGQPPLAEPLASGAWIDRTHGTLTTDAVRVYAVEPCGSSDRRRVDRPNFFFGRFPEESSDQTANRLVAYDLARQGKLAWRLGGPNRGRAATGSDDWSGVVFLGPPVAWEGRLVVLAEVRQAICLLEIDPEDGRVVWKQSLVGVERQIEEPLRLVGASPTWGRRLVYCPTTVGVVAAVDPLTRTIAWASHLPVDSSRMGEDDRRGWRSSRSGAGRLIRSGVGWREARAIEAGERLLVATPESDRLHAFDAASGEPLWSHRVSAGVLLAGATREGALVVESGGFSCWDLATGELAWRVAPPERDAPMGEGVWVGDDYLVALESGRLARLRTGGGLQRDERLKTLDLGADPLAAPPRLGVLIHHHGAFYSRSSKTLERYDPPREREESMEFYEQLLADNPGNRMIGDRLAAAMLLEGDLSDDRIDRLERLVSGPEARTRVLAMRVEQARQRGDLATLFDWSIELLLNAPRGLLLRPDPPREVSVDAWVRRRVRGALAEASGEQLALATNRVETFVRDTLSDQDDWAALEPLAAAVVGSRVSAAVLGPLEERLRRDGRAVEARLWRFRSGATTPLESHAGTNPGWSHRQVTAYEHTLKGDGESPLSSRPGRRSDTQLSAYHPRRGPLPAGSATHWRLRRGRGESRQMLGADHRGEARMLVTLDTMVDREAGAGGLGEPTDWLWGGLLVVNDQQRVRAYDATRVGLSGADELWSIGAGVSTGGPAVWLDPEGRRPPAPRRQEAEKVVWVDGEGVVTIAKEMIALRDHASGRLRWRRRMESPVKRVVGHAGGLYLELSNREGAILESVAGRYLGRWSPPAREQRIGLLDSSRSDWKMLAGGRLLLADRTRVGTRLRVFDLESQQVVWEEFLAPGVLVCRAGEASFGLLEESGRLRLIDVATAEERFVVDLPGAGEQRPVLVRIDPHGDRLLVAVSEQNPTLFRTRGYAPVGDGALIAGRLHCLDRSSGATLWPAPVELDGFAPLEIAVEPSPLVFYARIAATSGEPQSLRYGLLAIDLASGRSVYRNEKLSAGANEAVGWWVQRESAPNDRFLVRLGPTRVTLTLGDEAAPPAPPAQARVESPRRRDAENAQDLGDDLGELFRSLIQPTVPPEMDDD